MDKQKKGLGWLMVQLGSQEEENQRSSAMELGEGKF